MLGGRPETNSGPGGAQTLPWGICLSRAFPPTYSQLLPYLPPPFSLALCSQFGLQPEPQSRQGGRQLLSITPEPEKAKGQQTCARGKELCAMLVLEQKRSSRKHRTPIGIPQLPLQAAFVLPSRFPFLSSYSQFTHRGSQTQGSLVLETAQRNPGLVPREYRVGASLKAGAPQEGSKLCRVRGSVPVMTQGSLSLSYHQEGLSPVFLTPSIPSPSSFGRSGQVFGSGFEKKCILWENTCSEHG